MFMTLLAPILLILTADTLGSESSQNCTRIVNVTNREWTEEKIEKKDKGICFKASTGSVHLSLKDDYPCKEYRDAFGHPCPWKRSCNYPPFKVYDGCEEKSTYKSDECADYNQYTILWVSESNCLKVVSESSDDHIRLRYKRVDKKEDSMYDPCWERWNPCRGWWGRYRGGDSRRKPSRRRQPSVRRSSVRRRVTTPKPDLDKTFTAESGSFTSPNYPKSYKSGLKCIYKIKLEGSKRIELIFSHVDLAPGSNGNCTKDAIGIYDGIVKWSSRLYEFCGNGSKFVNKPIVSKNNELKIKFTSGSNSGNKKGFNASYGVYREPKAAKDAKTTGVIIGTTCGLVLFALTLLAIWRSKNSTELQVLSEILNGSHPDAIQKKAPPSYDDVMASPEAYPVSPGSKSKEVCWVEMSGDEEPPPYPGLTIRIGPADKLQEPDSEMSDDDVGQTRDIEAQGELESQDPDVGEGNVEKNEEREGDVAGYNNRESYVSDIKEGNFGENPVGERVVGKSDVGERVNGKSDVDGVVGKGIVGKSDVGEYIVGKSDVGERVVGGSDVDGHVVEKSDVGTESEIHRALEKGSSFGKAPDVKIDVKLGDFKAIERNDEKAQLRIGVQGNATTNISHL